MTIPSSYDFVKRISSRTRFSVAREDFLRRLTLEVPGRAFSTVSAAIYAYMLTKLNSTIKGMAAQGRDVTQKYFSVSIDISEYPNLSAHNDVEEIIWGFERCASILGISREKNLLSGIISDSAREGFLNMLQDFIVMT